jgi:hypothetical protein
MRRVQLQEEAASVHSIPTPGALQVAETSPRLFLDLPVAYELVVRTFHLTSLISYPDANMHKPFRDQLLMLMLGARHPVV